MLRRDASWIFFSFLSFEVLYSEHHLHGDGSFLVEHGVRESLFGDGVDFSWNAEAELMNGLKGFLFR